MAVPRRMDERTQLDAIPILPQIPRSRKRFRSRGRKTPALRPARRGVRNGQYRQVVCLSRGTAAPPTAQKRSSPRTTSVRPAPCGYRPVPFFVLIGLFPRIFRVPAIFVPEEIRALPMVPGNRDMFFGTRHVGRLPEGRDSTGRARPARLSTKKPLPFSSESGDGSHLFSRSGPPDAARP